MTSSTVAGSSWDSYAAAGRLLPAGRMLAPAPASVTMAPAAGPHAADESMLRWGLLIFPCLAGGLLWSMSRSSRLCWQSKGGTQRQRGRMPLWSAGLLLYCYALMIPGLFCTILSYDISASQGSMEIQKREETMGSFAADLWSEGGWLGSVLIILYAMVIPALKIVLLIAAEMLRAGTASQVRWARRCVFFLQAISKWAAPDMFAYVLIIHLVHGLDNPPWLLGTGDLGTAFACFSVFCVFSTIATLGLRAPAHPDNEKEGRKVANPEGKRRLRGVKLLLPVFGLVVIFAVLLGMGLSLPCMALRLDVEPLYEPNGPIPRWWAPMIAQLQLTEHARSDVSIVGSIQSLATSMTHGSANGFIGFVLYVVFVIAFTILDMLVLVVAAIQLNSKGKDLKGTEQQPLLALRISRVLKKLSMLDVAMVGIFLVVACGTVYRKHGIILSYRCGLVALLGAEVCHYVTYHLVTRAAPQDNARAEAANDDFCDIVLSDSAGSAGSSCDTSECDVEAAQAAAAKERVCEDVSRCTSNGESARDSHECEHEANVQHAIV